MKKFWNFKASDEKTGELILYGDISASTWWGDEITPQQFKSDLDALGDIENLNIFINSGGGDVFAGQAIHSMLKRHAAFKTVYIDGLAASIASVIAMVGDKIVMPKNASMMIHNAWAITTGNKDDLRKMADDLEKVDAGIVATYVEKTGLDEAEVIELMDAETWFTAAEAVEKGFADEMEDAKKIAASIDGDFLVFGDQRFAAERYRHIPKIENTKQELPGDGGDSEPNNGGESQPVEDISEEQKECFNKIKRKLLED